MASDKTGETAEHALYTIDAHALFCIPSCMTRALTDVWISALRKINTFACKSAEDDESAEDYESDEGEKSDRKYRGQIATYTIDGFDI